MTKTSKAPTDKQMLDAYSEREAKRAAEMLARVNAMYPRRPRRPRKSA
jgi:hypothetical protein